MTQLIYQLPESGTTWTDTTGDLAMALNNLAAGAGRQGAVLDRGAGAKAMWYRWRAWYPAATTPVVGEVARCYIKTSDGSHPDNDDGTGDIAVSSEDKLKGLTFIGSMIVDEAATSVEFVGHGSLFIPWRYIMPVIWNATADNFEATNNLAGFSLEPLPNQVQDAA